MSKWAKVVCFSFLVAAVALPIGLYVKKFGVGLWDNHEDWARMGSFFGGVLGPIITGSTLVFLGMQIKLQAQQRRDEDIRHTCSECEGDILKALPVIEEFLSNEDNVCKIEKQWHSYRDAKKSGNDEEVSKIAEQAFDYSLYFLASWSQIDVSLRTLKGLNRDKYNIMKWHILARIDTHILCYIDSLRSEQLSCSPTLFEQVQLNKLLEAEEG